MPDDLAAKSAQVAAAGGTMMIETEARVKGDAEWTLMSNSDFLVKAGEMECALITLVNDARPVIARDTVIELRCRYYCAQADRDPFWSDYSNVISFGTDDISQGGSSGTGVMPTEEADVCPLCHFCLRPLGLCIFIWLAILLLILVVLLVIVLVVRKRKHR